jgi:hypothetical protein
MTIPKAFELGGFTWRVKMCKMSAVYGECDYATHTLRIASHIDGKRVNAEQRYASFLHEFFHAALHTLGRNDDEELVAGLEQMMFQMMKSARHE